MASKKAAPTRPVVVELEGVSKKFIVRKDNSLKERLVTLGRAGRRHREDFWALRDLTLSIEAGTTVGLIGHNGSGKSTLLKLIGGILDPTKGSIRNRGRIAALLELGAGFHPDLTGRENVYLNASILGMSRKETDEQLEAILAFADIGDFIDSQVKFYSSGMYVRLAFAVAVNTDPDILLVDEVLAVGDEAFQRKCLDKIREFQSEGRTIILVTHSLGQVTELCSRAILLNRGEIVADGDPREAVAAFRDILEGRRLDSLTSSDGVGPVEPRITAVTAIPAHPGEQSELMPGDTLTVSLTVNCPVPIKNMIIAVQIDNTAGQVAYGTTTKRMGIALGVIEGERTVEFDLSSTYFGPGKYFVNVSLLSDIGSHLHDWPQAASFNTHDYGVAVGTVYAVPSFQISAP
jgi:ABC-2 type transport system ATP-binding protein